MEAAREISIYGTALTSWVRAPDSLPLSNLGDDYAVDQVRDRSVLGCGQCPRQRPRAIAGGAIPG
jgi:hypothetical protein